MKKTLILSLLLLYALGLSAQSYSNLWKKVEAADRADRPQTALSLCRDLRTKALREGNDAQLLKATLSRCYWYGFHPLLNSPYSAREVFPCRSVP